MGRKGKQSKKSNSISVTEIKEKIEYKPDSKNMIFKEDKFYRGKLLFPKDTVCEVPNRDVGRWIKRGGMICDVDAPEAPVSLDVPPKEEKTPVESAEVIPVDVSEYKSLENMSSSPEEDDL